MAHTFLFMTLLQHFHVSQKAKPYGLTSAKCVLKRRGGRFQRPRSSSLHRPHRRHLRLLFLPLVPSFFPYSLLFSHSQAGWHCIITPAGFIESRPMVKTTTTKKKGCLSIPVGNTQSAVLLLPLLTASLGMHLSDT